ncbi:hypothetical protein [Streptomyces canus]|uniref:hypothetical protein n=1 Tax=Streptomyces canus TaxID=58343 RepID=UPI003F4B9E5B
MAYTEPLPDEKAATTVAFLSRARASLAAHGFHRIVRVVTDNGAKYRAAVFVRSLTSWASRHQRTKPSTPPHNDKVERYQRTLTFQTAIARVRSASEVRCLAWRSSSATAVV